MPTTARPNILYVAHRVPHPPDKGERIRIFHTLEFLAKRARVHLASLADEPVTSDSLARLRAICARVSVVPLTWTRWLRASASVLAGGTATEGAFSSPALRRLIGEWTGETQFRAVIVSSSGLAHYLRLRSLRDVPAVVDLIDVDSQKWFDYAAASSFPRSWLYALEGRRLRRAEEQLPALARAVTLVSDAETRLYREFCRPGTVVAVPCGVDLAYFRPDEPFIPVCVFVGSLDYRPNVDAMSWFCRHVWPEIIRRRPDARMWLVGRRPVRAIRRLAEMPGVHVVGPVPDVRPYLDRATVVVAPLRIARGVQSKIIEAFAMGKAVVASPQSLVGLAATPGEHVVAASSATEWTEAVLGLLNDAGHRRRLGAAARRCAEQFHQWDRCLQPLVSLLGLTATAAEHSGAGEHAVAAERAA